MKLTAKLCPTRCRLFARVSGCEIDVVLRRDRVEGSALHNFIIITPLVACLAAWPALTRSLTHTRLLPSSSSNPYAKNMGYAEAPPPPLATLNLRLYYSYIFLNPFWPTAPPTTPPMPWPPPPRALGVLAFIPARIPGARTF